MTVYGYIRVSTAEQVSGTSLAEQRKRIEGAAMAAGLAAPVVIEDAGISGSKALDTRPGGARLCALLRPGDTVIAAKFDRLFRSASDALYRVEDWKSRGIRLVLIDMGLDPVSENGISKLFFTILAALAEFERNRILERTADGRAAKRANGGHTGGDAPFGYRVEGEGKNARLVEDPQQQEAIRHIRQLREQGLSLRRIADQMREHGFSMSHMAVKRICLTDATT